MLIRSCQHFFSYGGCLSKGLMLDVWVLLYIGTVRHGHGHVAAGRWLHQPTACLPRHGHPHGNEDRLLEGRGSCMGAHPPHPNHGSEQYRELQDSLPAKASPEPATIFTSRRSYQAERPQQPAVWRLWGAFG